MSADSFLYDIRNPAHTAGKIRQPVSIIKISAIRKTGESVQPESDTPSIDCCRVFPAGGCLHHPAAADKATVPRQFTKQAAEHTGYQRNSDEDTDRNGK